MPGAEESGRGGAVTTEETAELLGQVAMFSDLSEDELVRLAEVAVPRTYAAGEAVFRAGDTGDTCYVVRDGAVRVTRRHSDGRAITLAELRRGQMFGELALFSGETRSATVEATEPTSAVALLAGDTGDTCYVVRDGG
jgi:CRP/FNR family transcriptional regulator, cyclic AMP receptor protein